jgi:pimeloyl-ACP methyl ester carboxylesterase
MQGGVQPPGSRDPLLAPAVAQPVENDGGPGRAAVQGELFGTKRSLEPEGRRHDGTGMSQRAVEEAGPSAPTWQSKWLAALVVAMLAGLSALFAASTPRDHARIGVILLHGKMGTATDHRAGLNKIGSMLAASRHLAVVPSMPWRGDDWLNIGVDMPRVLDQIEILAASLRTRGATRIALIGHSLGANVALAYAAERGPVAGLVMAAPGHNPHLLFQRNPAIRDAIERARTMVSRDGGAEKIEWPDAIQGARLTVSTTANVYYSWMNPEGLAVMPVQARRLPASTPLLLVISRRDPFFDAAESSVYVPAARHPHSRYLAIGADHSTTPLAAATSIVQWLNGLPP